LDEIKAKGADVKFVDLGKVRIGFCQACEVCHQGPDCVLKDDAKDILQCMLDADGIVLASPVYLDQVTAQMKALLDRSSHFIHCLRLMGKYMAAVTTSGGGSGDATAAFIRRYAVTVGAQFVGVVHAPMPLRERILRRHESWALTWSRRLPAKTMWPEQVQAIEEQRKHFGRIIAFRKDQWPYEHKYWQEKGWL